MRFVFQYKNDEEKESLINTHIDKYVVEERNITEGNFLVFSDVSPEEEEFIRNNAVGEIVKLKQENETLKQSIAELSYLISTGGN